MKVLLAHNYYQHPGGEDQVFADEAALLEVHGHQVSRYTVDNDNLEHAPKLRLARDTLWNCVAASAIERLVREQGIEVAHFHNTLPQLSPAVYYAARRAGAAVVQTLHNFRLLCPGATFLRGGTICESCLGRTVAWPAMLHRCYRGSLAASAVLSGMLAAHRLAGTWSRAVDAYITLTDFARQRFLAGGLPADRLYVKPNFVFEPARAGNGQGGYLLFAGRLSAEKGLATLLAAWQFLPPTVHLRIAGDGPLADAVRSAAAKHAGIEWLGRLPAAEVARQMAGATAVLIPSICYENLPKALVESFAVGTPVIASRLGALPDLIDDGRTGLLFTAGDPQELARCVLNLLDDDAHRASMRGEARTEFENHYTADENHRQLMTIYECARARSRSGRLSRHELTSQGVRS